MPAAFWQLVPHNCPVVASAAWAGRGAGLGTSTGPRITHRWQATRTTVYWPVKQNTIVLTRTCQRRSYLAFSPGALQASHISRNSWYLGRNKWCQSVATSFQTHWNVSGLPVNRITFVEVTSVWVRSRGSDDCGWRTSNRQVGKVSHNNRSSSYRSRQQMLTHRISDDELVLCWW